MRLAYLKETRRGKPATALVQSDGSLLDVIGVMEAWGKQFQGDDRPFAFGDPSPLEIALIAAATTQTLQTGRTFLGESEWQSFVYPADAPLLPPIPRPNRILAIGRNYGEHAKELGNAVPEEPIVFMKASSCVVGPDAPIVIPDGVGRVDFEAELAIIIGKGGKNILEEDALAHIAAYTIFNDVTARDRQRAAQEKKHPWFLAKSLDTFGPLGPYLVTADEIPAPHNLPITLTVNGETRQEGNTGDMIFPIPYLISYLSRWMALEPGDLIATGTPPGVGPIVPGDTVEITIPGLGILRNPVE